jgi:hypothetical protein
MAAIIYLLIILAVIALYCLYIYVLFYVSFLLFPLGCAAFICVVLYNYIHTMWTELFVGTGWKDSPEGPEPAYRQYYFRKAYRDYELVVRKSWIPNRAAADWVIKTGTKLFTNGVGVWFTWPLGVTFFALAAAGAIAAAIAYFIFGIVHLLIVVTCAALAFCFALLLRFAEYVSMLWRRIFLVCPNAGCYKKISLPIYICPHCGVQHKRLIPGSYGIIRRRCQCGTKLPTLFLFGRNNLPSICPHDECRQPLSMTMGVVRNLHVPIVGGPAAGKTSFLMANMCELQQRADSGTLGLEFPEKKHQAMFEKSRQNFGRGVLLDKTASDSPDAFLVDFRDGGGHEGLLYMYDAAGELYQRTDVLRRHAYYEYTHGVLFLLDPFSLPQVQADFAVDLKAAEALIKPCEEQPQDVYARMMGTLREQSGMGKRFGNVPVAVVVTKADAFGLASLIQSANEELTTISSNGNNKGGQQKTDPESQSVRQWLLSNGEGNLVRSIEHDFKEIHYFYCSALGRLPDGSAVPFKPRGVIDPLDWILKHYQLELDGHGLVDFLPSRASRPATAFAPSTSAHSVNGMVVSGLWLATTLALISLFIGWLVDAQPWRNSFRFSRNNSGNSYVPPPAPSMVGRTGVTTTDVNLRAGVGSNYRKVGLAERNSRVRILSLSSDGSWYEVEILRHGRVKEDQSSADRGWLNGRFVSLN